MRELSIFVDESGDPGSSSKYYLLTLVLHDQGNSIADAIQTYERSVAQHKLPDIPMHIGPLIRGTYQYEFLEPVTRKRLMSSFRVFAERLPFIYHTFLYKKSEFEGDVSKIAIRLKRDLVVFLYDNLEFFQSFDHIKVYYDDGQRVITNALHDSIEYTISREAIVYKDARPSDYRLFQVADFVCGVELTAHKFEQNESTTTDHLMFGTQAIFKKKVLKTLRKHRL